MRTWTLTELPEPHSLHKQLRILAALDVILCEEEWLRVHRYEPNWRPGVDLGILENGAGDDLFILFAEEGCILKGFDHESSLSPHARDDGEVWPGMYDEVPKALFALLEDGSDTWELEDVTFCIWQNRNEPEWLAGDWAELDTLDDPREADGGANFLLGYLHKSAESYINWAQGYYADDMKLPVQIVEQIFSGAKVDQEMVAALSPGRNVHDALNELEKLGLA
ncbi:hypothetical protein DCC85_05645 [Paenibacillus sp. CAA11]|uniref:hypothetical protein n=1 Tax=Paenibacillus sp. CAA11 TaxID=1532905 RepID=UPI000D367652|nr:hypothetical protein [Paenibacillus sp. CAA11]AWB43754.1 hypothetical protein DCC85_05645 [Paenibacillus sp. CAA11]